MSTEQPEKKTDEVQERQVEDAPLRRSQEEADATNPEVEHDPTEDSVDPEEAVSLDKWEKDEQHNPRSR